MGKIYNLNPVSFITVDTVGQPGERVFYLQAGRGSQFVTLIIEKQHALALVASIDELLAELNTRYPKSQPTRQEQPFQLQYPLEPKFHVGQMGLGYDETVDMVVLIAYQIAETQEEESDIEYLLNKETNTAVARFWGTREQMQLLRDQALNAVNGGRPVCELCGESIDPEGHLCTRRNGHGNSRNYY
ncbi:MAG: DUF3090 family protein [Anaerolineales bacterium]|nr:DUF3090 family protein [Anaerolineales bacterium]